MWYSAPNPRWRLSTSLLSHASCVPSPPPCTKRTCLPIGRMSYSRSRSTAFMVPPNSPARLLTSLRNKLEIGLGFLERAGEGWPLLEAGKIGRGILVGVAEWLKHIGIEERGSG